MVKDIKKYMFILILLFRLGGWGFKIKSHIIKCLAKGCSAEGCLFARARARALLISTIHN